MATETQLELYEDSIVSVQKLCEMISNSANNITELEATELVRKLIQQKSLPVDVVISSGIVVKCIQLLTTAENSVLLLNAARILIQVAAGTQKQAKALVKLGAIPNLAELIHYPDDYISRSVVFILAKIAAHGPTVRDSVLDTKAMSAMLSIIDK